jgi:hypothetical protein
MNSLAGARLARYRNRSNHLALQVSKPSRNRLRAAATLTQHPIHSAFAAAMADDVAAAIAASVAFGR